MDWRSLSTASDISLNGLRDVSGSSGASALDQTDQAIAAGLHRTMRQQSTATDDFMMYVAKIAMCPNKWPHDWWAGAAAGARHGQQRWGSPRRPWAAKTASSRPEPSAPQTAAPANPLV